jgi:tagaturonate reductase
MRLSRQTLQAISSSSGIRIPDQSNFSLPEKVLQFGTGVFIRGLIDYFIDKANHENIFNGRVVMVKSTDAGDIEDFHRQDCLYTLVMQSVEENKEVEEKVIIGAISRVLHAANDWRGVLECALNPELKIILSNTTETGIVLVEDDRADAAPPSSFPGKLLSFLLARYNAFEGSEDSGMVIVPTELIPGNGTKLKSIVNQLAVNNNLDKDFISWLNTANDFCNSLVDRIVPGKPPAAEHKQLESKLGYEDDLMVMAETFGLWAIETSSSRSRDLLSFSKAHAGIHIVDDIEKFRELKLRLLNGSHNLSCALGFIAGFDTVKEAMADAHFDRYMRRLILDDIASSILSDKINKEDTYQFGSKVLDRYRNPHISFEWLSICVQDTSKIRIRAVPIVLQHYRKYGYVPDCISLGFAAYILFMKSERTADGNFAGNINGKKYVLEDDFAPNMHDKWKMFSGLMLVEHVLGDKLLWEEDLNALNGFAQSTAFYLKHLEASGFYGTVELAYQQRTPDLKTSY